MHIPTSHSSRRRAAILAVGLTSLIAPAAASADSIVYIDGGNVWSAHSDGSGKVQLTDGGDWNSPTQSDDGTIAAVKGTGPIQVMARDGRPLRSIETTYQKASDGSTFAPRPVALSFSPDGSKIAYSYAQYSCSPGATCGQITKSVFYTDANVTTASPVEKYGNQMGSTDPEWVTNSRTIMFGGFLKWSALDDVGPGDNSQVPWQREGDDKGDGEISRDGRHLVTTSLYGANKTIAFWEVRGDAKTESPPAQPALACELTQKDPQYSDPSWSPDGLGVAYKNASGVQILRFTAIVGDDRCDVQPGSERTFSATASSPDWGPADPPAARYSDPGPGPVKVKAKAVVSITKPKISVKALRKGLVVKVAVRRAGTLGATLSYKGKRLASARKKVRKAGTVKLRLSKVPARKARRVKGKRVKLAATLRPKGAAASKATGSYKVR